MAKPVNHDAYIAAAPQAFQPLLAQLRAQLTKVLPDAEELIMYDMPGFGFGKTIFAGYAAFSRQCGLYVSKGAITAHSDEIEMRRITTGSAGIAGRGFLISTFDDREPSIINLYV
jgi:uncharacterized protein YdhG (YjbR/CyaY superfamily)